MEKRVYTLWKNPVDLSTAFYPVKYDPVIGGNLTPDPVLSGTDAIVVFKTPHFVDIEITKNVFLCGDPVKDQPLNPGPIPSW